VGGPPGQRLSAGRRAHGDGGRATATRCPCAAPNIPVERTAHSAGLVVVPSSVGCGPPLTGGVGLTTLRQRSAGQW
jgi:hypothetical protein